MLPELVRSGVAIIVLLATPDIRRATAYMRSGCYDCLSVPFRRDELRATVSSAMIANGALVSRHKGHGDDRTGDAESGFGMSLVAESAELGSEPPSDGGFLRIPAIDRRLTKYASQQFPVLLRGESGTGKDIAARIIHERSPRASGPFVVRNCAAVPDSLFETEFFGSEAGAYTGAVTRAGAFEHADRGTIFLDEVGELSLSKQAALLRMIEEGVVRRVGSSSRRRVSFRLITATNRTLRDEVAAGRFRRDLYYRIYVLAVKIPPLRERVAEIPALCRRFAAETSGEDVSFTAQAIALLQMQPWPGNVRELRNIVQRLTVVAEDGTIDRELVLSELSRDSD